ncbi:hypothetical protein [Micromonospora sp. NPDC000668]|uniref:hypothetical protein n=1 Tax=Micromonospora sp. NPDC000668 TaxID=3364219 RepID=UPI003691E0F8
MDPEGFRLNLNALVQNLRNVTWLLQKQKNSLPEFQSWYGDWQSSVKSDPVMTWVVKARNRIVKEADLEIYSEARVRVSRDWTHEYENTFNFPPRFRNRDILRAILTRNAIAPEGTISVNRRWVDQLLPDWELLDATSRAYGHLTQVVQTAHRKAGVSACNLAPRTPSCVTADAHGQPVCMDSSDENRLLHVDLKTGYEIAEIRAPFNVSSESHQAAAERYGVDFGSVSGDAIARVPGLLAIAKRVLSVDKSHLTFAYIMIGDQVAAHFPMLFPDQNSKRLALRRFAEEVRKSGGDGIVLVGEQWVADVEPGEDLRTPNVKPARDRPNRMEAITVTAMTKDGRLSEVIEIFRRRRGEIVYDGDLSPDLGGEIPNFLLPVARVWELGPFRPSP